MPYPLFKLFNPIRIGVRRYSSVFWKKKLPIKAGEPARECLQEIAGVDPFLKTCSCHITTIPEEKTVPPLLKMKHSARSVPSLLLSVLVAFFPKCPMCWAAYMSLFGSVSLAQTPYQGWLFPVLLGFLGLHLFLVFRKRREKGYGPFVLSLAGALVLLISRGLVLPGNALLIVGMLCILTGSLWNSFSFNRLEASITQ
jgi:hypothetical protein